MDLNKIWEDESVRGLDALANEGVKIDRNVEDKLTLRYPPEVWRKLFNVGEGYESCGPDWAPYSGPSVVVRFIRKKAESKNA